MRSKRKIIFKLVYTRFNKLDNDANIFCNSELNYRWEQDINNINDIGVFRLLMKKVKKYYNMSKSDRDYFIDLLRMQIGKLDNDNKIKFLLRSLSFIPILRHRKCSYLQFLDELIELK